MKTICICVKDDVSFSFYEEETLYVIEWGGLSVLVTDDFVAAYDFGVASFVRCVL